MSAVAYVLIAVLIINIGFFGLMVNSARVPKEKGKKPKDDKKNKNPRKK